MTSEATQGYANHPTITDFDPPDIQARLVESPRPLAQGSYGFIYDFATYVHADQGRVHQLLKLLKPAQTEAQTEQVQAEFSREIDALSQLGATPGIPRITWSGHVVANGQRVPAFAYEKIEPAVNLARLVRRQFDDRLTRISIEPQTLFDLALRAMETLEKVHASGIRHLDIQPGNILVARTDGSRGGNAPFNVDLWFIDFGKSAIPSDNTRRANLSNGMPQFMSEDQKNHVIQNNGRYSREVLLGPRSANWDLFALGECLRILAVTYAFRSEEQQHRAGLEQLSDSLQKPGSSYEDRLASAREIAALWKRAVPKLNVIKVRTFVASHASIDPALTSILDSGPVQRLRRVQQLGFTQLLYPGATHTRFAHTLGVVDLATRYIDKVNAASPTAQIAPDERIACLTYALLHDVGHYPFAHYLEEIDAGSLPAVAGLLHHERVGKATYHRDNALPDLFSNPLADAIASANPNLGDSSGFKRILGTDGNRTHIGQIIDGPIEADKLDYLIRDGNACGISYANGIDVERLLDSLKLIKSQGELHLGLSAKGIASASELYYARFHMYSEVYYHKVSRSIAAAIKRAFFRVVQAKKLTGSVVVAAALGVGEHEFIAYFLRELGKLDDGRYSTLLNDPFGAHGRRLFKRIRSYSDIWLLHTERSKEMRLLSKLRVAGRNFEALGLIEEAVDQELARTLAMPQGVWPCVLIDVPPSKGVTAFPFVEDARETGYLNKVSPIVRSAAEAQALSQRVRIFASRDTHDALLRAPRRFVWNPTVRIVGRRRARWACGQAAFEPVHMSTGRLSGARI